MSSISPAHADEAAQSSFYNSLYAPYSDPTPPRRPPRPPPYKSTTCKAKANMTLRPEPDMSSSDEEDEELDAPEIPQHLLDQPAYNPLPNWAWTTGHPVSGTKLLRKLRVDATCSTSLIKGKIDGTELTYICKSWSRASRPSWLGIYSELKLYASPQYLRDLQGIVIPYLINLYDGPDAISFFMSTPHHSFWMEASPDMPNVLKKAVVRAYVILHSRGILHGAVELHNMLIGGDGRVTLVDFRFARALKPLPDLGLEQAWKSDLALELRQVMYKLDYEGARAREDARMTRFTALEQRNREKRARGVGDREEKPMLEELEERPPMPEVWKSQWINGLDAEPRRHVVPGQAPDELERCIESFRAVIQSMQAIDAAEMVSPLLEFRHPPPSSPPSGSSGSSPLPPRSNSRKRKTGPTSEDSPHTTKRARPEESGGEAAPAPPRYERSSTTYHTGTPGTLLRAASTQTAAPKADRVRDFAYEPYNGPRGYYFPHPPSEALRDSMRTVQIRNANAIACGQQGLPYFRMDQAMLQPPAYKRFLPKGMHVSLGALKRKRAAADNFLHPEERRRVKRQQFEEDRAAALAENRAVRFNDRISYRSPPRETDYRDAAAAPLPPPSVDIPGGVPRSVLKYTPPVKTVSYDLSLWSSKSRGIDEGTFGDGAGPSSNSEDVSLQDPSVALDGSQSHPSAVPDEPGQLLPNSGLAQAQMESPPSENETSAADSDTPASSASPWPFRTGEDPAAASSAASSVSSPESMVRASDAGVATRDPRTMATSRDGERSRAPSLDDERDLEEEMEVEALLFS